MPKDVFKDGIITHEEIRKSFAKYFQNVDDLIDQYEFGCIEHEDFRCKEVTRQKRFNINGSGFPGKDPDMIHYDLSSAILWVTKCECGWEGVVGFYMTYNTSEWSIIKKILDKEKVSERDLYRTQLAPTSKIEFISYAPFGKKRRDPSNSARFHYWNDKDLDDYLG